MAILSTVGCLIGILHPQHPGTTGSTSPGFESPRAHPVIHHAHALPPDTLLAVGLNPVRPHENELRRSGLGRLFEEQKLPPQIVKVLEQLGDAVGESTDLGRRELDQLWRGGMTLAWTSLTEGRLVGWVALVNLGDLTEDVERAVEHLQARLEGSGGKTRTDMWRDIVLWTTRFEGMGVAYTIWDDMLIAGSTRREVQAALERIDGPMPTAFTLE